MIKKIIRKITLSYPFALLFHTPCVGFGVLYFKLFQKTPWVSYWSMRKAYAVFGHNFINKLNLLLQKKDTDNKYYQTLNQSNFNYTEQQIIQITQEIKKNGYSILPFTLTDDAINELTRVAKTSICEIADPVNKNDRYDYFSINSQKGHRFNIQESDLIKNKLVLDLANDSLFLKIAYQYFESIPINDLITMWWNIPGKNIDHDKIAQMYHFDMDRPKWLKFFFYLTDVDQNNGPHAFIKESHVDKKHYHDQRLTDEEVYKLYGKNKEVVFTGKRGLILAEDTLGLHKGFELQSGHRLLFQLEYSTTLFGQEYH